MDHRLPINYLRLFQNFSFWNSLLPLLIVYDCPEIPMAHNVPAVCDVWAARISKCAAFAGRTKGSGVQETACAVNLKVGMERIGMTWPAGTPSRFSGDA
jgi:hypothetical protein